jgi:hypothetical protein
MRSKNATRQDEGYDAVRQVFITNVIIKIIYICIISLFNTFNISPKSRRDEGYGTVRQVYVCVRARVYSLGARALHAAPLQGSDPRNLFRCSITYMYIYIIIFEYIIYISCMYVCMFVCMYACVFLQVLGLYMLRRTKDQTLRGKPIVDLPAKVCAWVCACARAWVRVCARECTVSLALSAASPSWTTR